MSSHTYSLSGNFPGGKVNLTKLDKEIRESSIATALDYVAKAGDVVTVSFKADLPAGEQTALNALVPLHDNTPSKALTKVDIANAPQVHPVKISELVAKRAYVFSPSFTDKTTWYNKSVQVTDEVPSGAVDGVNTTYALANEFVIDLTHGKVTDESLLPAPATGSWYPVVKINGVTKTARPPFADDWSEGGDYYLDYVNGDVIFQTPPTVGSSITVSYRYSPNTPGNSIQEYGPLEANKKWIITVAEAQFSKNLVMNDSVMWAAYVVPGDILVSPITEYKTFGNFLDFSFGSFPVVPAMGGPKRGLAQETVLLRWDYLSSIEIKASDSVKIRVWLKDDKPYGGERATVTLYALEEDE